MLRSVDLVRIPVFLEIRFYRISVRDLGHRFVQVLFFLKTKAC